MGKGSWNRVIASLDDTARRAERIGNYRRRFDDAFPDRIEKLANGYWKFPDWEVYAPGPAPVGQELVLLIQIRRRQREMDNA